jgi:hypothetical protein
MMGFLHNITLELKSETPKLELAAFLEQLPDTAVISTVVRTTPKDRPWESERTHVSLQARWISE